MSKPDEILLKFNKHKGTVPGTGDFINVTNLSDTDSGLFLVQLAE
jgi:hypothetical protein